MFEFFSPVLLALPVLLFGVLPAIGQFLLLPLNLLGVQNLSYPLLHVFGAVATIVVVAVCLLLLVRKKYHLIFPTLCIGFALSALYTSLPLLLNLERELSGDGFTVLGTPAAFVFVAVAGLSLLVSKIGTFKILATMLLVTGTLGYLLFCYTG